MEVEVEVEKREEEKDEERDAAAKRKSEKPNCRSFCLLFWRNYLACGVENTLLLSSQWNAENRRPSDAGKAKEEMLHLSTSSSFTVATPPSNQTPSSKRTRPAAPLPAAPRRAREARTARASRRPRGRDTGSETRGAPCFVLFRAKQVSKREKQLRRFLKVFSFLFSSLSFFFTLSLLSFSPLRELAGDSASRELRAALSSSSLAPAQSRPLRTRSKGIKRRGG